jgi:hypothetical protein
MKRFLSAVVPALIVVALSAPYATAQNLLANPGFEDPVTADGPPFVGSWEAFQGGGPLSQNSTTMPRSGAQHLELFINNQANNFAGAFQDVPNLVPGQSATFSGWHKLVSGGAGGTEIRIEWRNSVSNTEVSRTPNLVPPITSDYTQFSLVAVVPAGADLARPVYAIQSFGGPPTQQVFVDDASFTVIPEPTSLAMCLVGLVLHVRRRRQAVR